MTTRYIGREFTVEDMRERAHLSGQPVHFVDLDGHGEPTVWVWEPDAAEPQPVIRRIDLPERLRARGWEVLTAHLPKVGE